MALLNKEYGGIKTGIGFSKKPIDSMKKDVLRGIVKKRMPNKKLLPKIKEPQYSEKEKSDIMNSWTKRIGPKGKLDMSGVKIKRYSPIDGYSPM